MLRPAEGSKQVIIDDARGWRQIRRHQHGGFTTAQSSVMIVIVLHNGILQDTTRYHAFLIADELRSWLYALQSTTIDDYYMYLDHISAVIMREQ